MQVGAAVITVGWLAACASTPQSPPEAEAHACEQLRVVINVGDDPRAVAEQLGPLGEALDGAESTAAIEAIHVAFVGLQDWAGDGEPPASVVATVESARVACQDAGIAMPGGDAGSD